jgi:hypothetical protein
MAPLDIQSEGPFRAQIVVGGTGLEPVTSSV